MTPTDTDRIRFLTDRINMDRREIEEIRRTHEIQTIRWDITLKLESLNTLSRLIRNRPNDPDDIRPATPHDWDGKMGERTGTTLGQILRTLGGLILSDLDYLRNLSDDPTLHDWTNMIESDLREFVL